MNLFFLDYNTYGNRIVKKESNLSDYLLHETAREVNVAFAPNDGIDTVQVLNNKTADVGNYVVVADSQSNIVSRWFVMESIYKNNGQHLVKLHRDLMVDYWDGIKSAPCFIEKATVPSTDSAIFNKENMTFNQIKTSETPLKDETGCAWVVGYIPRDAFTKEAHNIVNGDVILEYTEDFSFNTLEDFPYYTWIGQTYNGRPYNVLYDTFLTEQSQGAAGYRSRFNNNNENVNVVIGSGTEFTSSSIYTSTQNYARDIYGSDFLTHMAHLPDFAFEDYTNYSGNIQSNPTLEELMAFDNKIIKIGNLYYKATMEQSVGYDGNSYVTAASELGTDWWSYLVKTHITGTPNNKSFRLTYKYDKYVLTFSQVFTHAQVDLNDTRYHLEDQPYDMFCIPYSDTYQMSYTEGGVTKTITANKSVAVNMAVAIGKELGSGNIYDIQLLPYCPVRYMLQSDGSITIGSERVHYVVDTNDSDKKIGVIFWATTSAFTIDIPYTINVTDAKIENECDLWRLSSPNFNGQFEFSAAKNGGVTSFNVDCNYKPFNPYIHVNPNFGRLYGQDFNDARGLICGGDFSLPQLSNAWSNYELQNKNYQNIFDRQIQNMEVNNTLSNIKGAVSALGNAVGSGLATGSIGVGLGSAVAGALDVGMQIAQQQETLDYTKDLFGYQLGNIKAIPTNLTKTTAFTYNNKIFPILEYYTCTAEERQALVDKIKYNGMTIMRIGKIEDYVREEQTYIKGQLIRLQVNEDNHLLEAIRQEVNKGVYV